MKLFTNIWNIGQIFKMDAQLLMDDGLAGSGRSKHIQFNLKFWTLTKMAESYAQLLMVAGFREVKTNYILPKIWTSVKMWTLGAQFPTVVSFRGVIT